MRRIIFHIDCNSFLLAVKLKCVKLKGKPAVVAGDPKERRGIVLAANYLAFSENGKRDEKAARYNQLWANMMFQTYCVRWSQKTD